MNDPTTPVLVALADRYRRSSAANRDVSRDFTIDYESLLREAHLEDGDARELAETHLQLAERESQGLLQIDRASRSNQPQRIRLKLAGGAAWLFEKLGIPAPHDERAELAAFFNDAATLDLTDQPAWKHWCTHLAEQATNGGSVHPFKRSDPLGNRALLTTLIGVLRWRGESLIRFASSVICGNSKTLESIEGKLLAAIRAIRNDDSLTLEDLGILRKPRTLTFHGSLILSFDGASIDYSPQPGPATISETNLIQATAVQTQASVCLTVENEEVFLELAKHNPNWLLIHTSFPGSAVRRMLDQLPQDITFIHFGDSDPAGFDILRDLREKSGRTIIPLCMAFRTAPQSPSLTTEEITTINRLLSNPQMADVHHALEAMLAANTKGLFEQESIPIDEVLSTLRKILLMPLG